MEMETVKLPFYPHPLTLSRRGRYECNACSFHMSGEEGTPFYLCRKYSLAFHKECAEASEPLDHPYHPRHTLHLITTSTFQTNGTCNWCHRRIGTRFYQCPICDFRLHVFCAAQKPLLEMETPATKGCHHNKLTLLPRESFFTCNACGRSHYHFPVYACLPCDHMVHRECLDLPRVIRISRHEHRISWVSSLPLPTEQWVCRICHVGVDGRYGAFSCTKGCGYVAHSLCATSKDVWDGEELEGVPEEDLEDVEPFEDIGEGLIRHFSHVHHRLRFFTAEGEEENWFAWGESNRCQACLLPICSGDFFGCMENDCGFYLHGECASLPRKKWHGSHPHLLVLHAGDISFDGGRQKGFYSCNACSRFSCGFRYVCHKESFTRVNVDLRLPSTSEDAFPHFILDVRCASISEPLNHKGHAHPLFFNYKQGYNVITCGACRMKSNYVLKCFFRSDTGECGFHLCYKCATLPDTVRYKFDRHELTLCCREEASGAYWCEICEEEMDPTLWFYTCDVCRVTVHVDCALGSDPYAKTGRCVPNNYEEEDYFDIVSNSNSYRPLCHSCGRHCQDALVVERHGRFFCSLRCFGNI